MPRLCAVQNALSGQMPQAGLRGVQIVAPRSIIACAWSPGRSAGVSGAANAVSSGLAAGSGVSTANSRAMTRSTLPSTTVDGSSNAMAAIAAAVYGPTPGSARSVSLVAGNRPAVFRHDGARALQQVAGAGVIPEPRPFGHHVFIPRCGQCADIRPAVCEAPEIAAHGSNGRLLQHDFGQPDAVRVGPDARPPVFRGDTPGHHAGMDVIPGQKCPAHPSVTQSLWPFPCHSAWAAPCL